MKGSNFLIFIGVVVILTSILVIWGSTQIMVTRRDYYISKTLQVSPRGYSYQVITFYPDWATSFTFTIEGGTIKYVLLDADNFDKWNDGQYSPQWIETSSDFYYWETGISGTMHVNGVEVPHPPMYYLFYNEDSYSKTIYFESFKDKHESVTNYFYMSGGFLLLAVGAGSSMFGLYKRFQS